MGAHKVVGVDIDDALIQAAWRRRRVVWSLQAPDDMRSDPVQESGGDSRFPGTGSQESPTISSGANYFPASCEHTFGHLPIPSSRDRHTEFPHNVLFRTADWLDNSIHEDADGYDVVVACVFLRSGLGVDFLSSFLVRRFSVTKWVHLNGGDGALKKFFQKAYSCLHPGGTFILEPQQWETYSKSKRLDNVRDHIIVLYSETLANSDHRDSKRTRTQFRYVLKISRTCYERWALVLPNVWVSLAKEVGLHSHCLGRNISILFRLSKAYRPLR